MLKEFYNNKKEIKSILENYKIDQIKTTNVEVDKNDNIINTVSMEDMVLLDVIIYDRSFSCVGNDDILDINYNWLYRVFVEDEHILQLELRS